MNSKNHFLYCLAEVFFCTDRPRSEAFFKIRAFLYIHLVTRREGSSLYKMSNYRCESGEEMSVHYAAYESTVHLWLSTVNTMRILQPGKSNDCVTSLTVKNCHDSLSGNYENLPKFSKLR